MPTDTLAWLRWVLIPNLGLKRSQELLNYIDSPESLFLHPDRWQLPNGIKQTIREMNHLGEQHPVHRRALEQLQWAEQDNHNLISFDDDSYPNQLNTIDDFPLMLWARGRPDLLHSQQVAIVGSRSASANALRHTQNISAYLCRAGLAVTSGGALGVDTAAHQAAMREDGATIAILGCGVDTVYPKSNRQLFNSMSEKGLILSEYPLGTSPKAGHFPRRNRLISALSDVIIVIEAALKSGTLITAQHALEQGKDIFALPGDIGNPNNAGCHKLIQEGAQLLSDPEDIIDHLRLQPDHCENRISRQLDHLNPIQKQILILLQQDITPLESLAHELAVNASQLLEPILELELEGLIEQHPGGYVLSADF